MVSLEFVSKRPYITVKLHVTNTVDSASELQAVYDTLLEIGWKPRKQIKSEGNAFVMEWAKDGVGFGGDWHRFEKKILLQQVKDKLAQVGYSNIPYRLM